MKFKNPVCWSNYLVLTISNFYRSLCGTEKFLNKRFSFVFFWVIRIKWSIRRRNQWCCKTYFFISYYLLILVHARSSLISARLLALKVQTYYYLRQKHSQHPCSNQLKRIKPSFMWPFFDVFYSSYQCNAFSFFQFWMELWTISI
jgi:hypothetical protein